MKSEFGIQPLDEILNKCSLKNEDLVRASNEQLTHKQVQKGRQGKAVTINIKRKIMRALNRIDEKNKYTQKELFNY
jgi:hypothetical protein